MVELQKFKLYLSKSERKPSTVYRHLNTLKLFLTQFRKINYKNVDNLILTYKQRNYTNSYLNSIICTARIYGKFTNQHKLANYPFFRKNYSIKATMSDKEIEAFLNLPCPSTGTSKERYARWTLFFSILAFTGMRPGECAGLTVDNIDFGREVFVLEETKTGKPRFVPIPPNINGKLKKYLSECNNHLFPSERGGVRYGKPIVDNVDWHYNFHARLKRLNIKRKNLTPYSLRHSLITRLLEEDVNLFKVQKIVGHSDLRTTAHYTHLTTKDIQKAIKRHPLIRRKTDPENILKIIEETIESFRLAEDKRFDYRFNKSKCKLELMVEIPC